MTKEGRLTKRQKEILEYIKKYSAQKIYFLLDFPMVYEVFA